MAKPTYFEVLKWASSFLAEQQKEPYLAEYLLVERLKWTKTKWVSHLHQEVPDEVLAQFKADLNQVLADVPAQYVIGSCEFYGTRFKVTEATLIPRPETEELVALCLQRNSQLETLEVVDIGTGTGAIALTLKRLAPNWQVTGIDLSPAALAVAKANQRQQKLEVNLLAGDLTAPLRDQKVDIIISNPPYISRAEWELMDVSVRTYEPKLALFADNDGLAVYQRLARELPRVIKPKGKIYLEIGYKQGPRVKALFEAAFPEKKVTLSQDLNGHDRLLEIWG